MGVRSADVRAVLQVLDDVAFVPAQRVDDLGETLLDGLARLVPSDSAWWAVCDYRRRRNLMTSSDDRLGPVYTARQERWWELAAQHPILVFRDAGGDGRALTLSDVVGRRALRELELYEEFFHPYGIEYAVSVRIPISSARAIDVGCTRADRDFSARDRDVLDLLRPALGLVFRRAERPALDEHGLTPREREVLQLVAAGLSNRAIAETLVVAPGTVKKHLDGIYEKLGVSNRTEAAARLVS